MSSEGLSALHKAEGRGTVQDEIVEAQTALVSAFPFIEGSEFKAALGIFLTQDFLFERVPIFRIILEWWDFPPIAFCNPGFQVEFLTLYLCFHF